jgi:hypothetical protein
LLSSIIRFLVTSIPFTVPLFDLPAAKTEEELHTCAEEDESSNPGLFLSVDGKEFKDLEKYRVHSRVFDVNFAENPIGGKPGPDRAVSDGYWVILEPLSPGKHDIHFKASLNNPTTGTLFYNDDLKYTINYLLLCAAYNAQPYIFSCAMCYYNHSRFDKHSYE